MEKYTIHLGHCQCSFQKFHSIISDKARKKFTSTFEDMIKQLYAAGLKKKKDQLSAFKHFINEFGTHYAAATELGTKLTIERRYSAKVTRKKTMCNASNH